MRSEPEARDERDRLGRRLRVVADLDVVLDARRTALGVLAHEHDVDVVVAAARRRSCCAGRTFAYRSNVLRSATLTERKPSPTGVSSGPLSASRVRLIESSVASGIGSPYVATPAMPATCRSHSNVGARGLENADGGVGDVGPDAVAGNQRDREWPCRGSQRAQRAYDEVGDVAPARLGEQRAASTCGARDRSRTSPDPDELASRARRRARARSTARPPCPRRPARSAARPGRARTARRWSADQRAQLRGERLGELRSLGFERRLAQRRRRAQRVRDRST